MYKMSFKFNPIKLKNINSNLSEALALEWLDDICTHTNFKKVGEGEYEIDEEADFLGSLMLLIGKIESQSWLVPGLDSWTTYCEEEGEVDALKELLEQEKNTED